MARDFPYDSRLRPLARRLRKQMTRSERCLWSRLRSRQVHGYVFYRQFIITRFIVDFYCRPLQLAVEVDGISHAAPEAVVHDRERQEALEALGIAMLRVPAGEVLQDLDAVIFAIGGEIERLEQRLDNGGSSKPASGR